MGNRIAFFLKEKERERKRKKEKKEGKVRSILGAFFGFVSIDAEMTLL